MHPLTYIHAYIHPHTHTHIYIHIYYVLLCLGIIVVTVLQILAGYIHNIPFALIYSCFILRYFFVYFYFSCRK
ncbi:hypothetical protein J3Q64DRAFT_1232701 [Phycomyces blakesleeanus]|uniref:Uncharacterized protein n=1 Tax=Phycomyces blakesleeanus TaxID=4837 RepID=A0ABR3B9Y1_PHYBL